MDYLIEGSDFIKNIFKSNSKIDQKNKNTGIYYLYVKLGRNQVFLL